MLMLFSALFSLATFAGDDALARFEFSQPQMGTQFKIIVYAKDNESARTASTAAFVRIAQLNKIMSDYTADSELMQLCAKAGGEPVKISRELFEILNFSQKIAAQSDGAFDVTIGPLVMLWRQSRKTRTLPSAEEIARAKAVSGWRLLQLDAEKQTAQLLKAGMRLDLGGVAKGYAADKALEVLQSHGIASALVIAGGDIRGGAPPPGKDGWTVGLAPLENPDARPAQYVSLRDAALSTSGDAEQFVEINGTRYSHIVDPRTGLGRTGRSSTTVHAPQGMIADALDTAASVLGPGDGIKLIDEQPGAAGIMFVLTADGVTSHESKRWRDVPKTQAKDSK